MSVAVFGANSEGLITTQLPAATAATTGAIARKNG
jgi:hypothetical protein